MLQACVQKQPDDAEVALIVASIAAIGGGAVGSVWLVPPLLFCLDRRGESPEQTMRMLVCYRYLDLEAPCELGQAACLVLEPVCLAFRAASP